MLCARWQATRLIDALSSWKEQLLFRPRVCSAKFFPSLKITWMHIRSSQCHTKQRVAFSICCLTCASYFGKMLLKHGHPAHKLWIHPLFSTDEFNTFASKLKAKMLAEKLPQTLQLNEVVPDLMDHLKKQQQHTFAHIDEKIS
jgi:hypothetical protein